MRPPRAFEKEHLDSLIDDVQESQRRVVLAIRLAVERMHADFIFCPMAGSITSKLDRHDRRITHFEAALLHPLPVAPQIDLDRFQLATDEPKRRGDPRLLFHVGVGQIARNPRGDIAHFTCLPVATTKTGASRPRARKPGLRRIHRLEIMTVRVRRSRQSANASHAFLICENCCLALASRGFSRSSPH